jgi:hypothetical protein
MPVTSSAVNLGRASPLGKPVRGRSPKGAPMNRTRPGWVNIPAQLIQVSAAVVGALQQLGLTPLNSAAAGTPGRLRAVCSPPRPPCRVPPPRRGGARTSWANYTPCPGATARSVSPRKPSMSPGWRLPCTAQPPASGRQTRDPPAPASQPGPNPADGQPATAPGHRRGRHRAVH